MNNQFSLFFPGMKMKKNYIVNIMSTDPHKILSIHLNFPMFDDTRKIRMSLIMLKND